MSDYRNPVLYYKYVCLKFHVCARLLRNIVKILAVLNNHIPRKLYNLIVRYGHDPLFYYTCQLVDERSRLQHISRGGGRRL